MVLGIVAVALMVGIAPSRTRHVPGEVPLAEALQQAEQGDVIGIAPGTHKIEGAAPRIPPEVIVCTDIKPPGVVVIGEARPNAWSWRCDPVFVLDAARGPGSADNVTFRGITFRYFDRTLGPSQFEAYSIFEIWNGKLLVDDCLCEDFHGTVLRLGAGRTDLENNQFTDNGPLTYVLDVGSRDDAYAHSCCFEPDSCERTGRITGRLRRDRCEISGTNWEVLDGGVLITTDGKGQARRPAWSRPA
jgi:hypothetical protein